MNKIKRRKSNLYLFLIKVFVKKFRAFLLVILSNFCFDFHLEKILYDSFYNDLGSRFWMIKGRIEKGFGGKGFGGRDLGRMKRKVDDIEEE